MRERIEPSLLIVTRALFYTLSLALGLHGQNASSHFVICTHHLVLFYFRHWKHGRMGAWAHGRMCVCVC